MSWKTIWIKSADLKRVAYALDTTADLRDDMTGGKARGAYASNAQRKSGASEQDFETELNRLGLYNTVAATLGAGRR